MKMITAYIQPKRLDSVRQVLSEIDINGVSVTEVKGLEDKKATLSSTEVQSMWWSSCLKLN
jgi:nitrogen regulatory protein PII